MAVTWAVLSLPIMMALMKMGIPVSGGHLLTEEAHIPGTALSHGPDRRPTPASRKGRGRTCIPRAATQTDERPDPFRTIGTTYRH